MIKVVNYGAGNMGNVLRALKALKLSAETAKTPPGNPDPKDILILPGVGAFPAAYANLKSSGWINYIERHHGEGGPILGICLGMQLLCEASFEDGYTKGLGLIPGEIVPLDIRPKPHTGWNELCWLKKEDGFDVSPFEGPDMYFVHGYCLLDSPAAMATTTVQEVTFVSAVKLGNVMGFQFHPERSGRLGLRLLQASIAYLQGRCDRA